MTIKGTPKLTSRSGRCDSKWWEVDGIEPLAQKGLRLQRSDGTSLSLFALPELAET